MGQGSCIDLCVRERENIMVTYDKFGNNIKMPGIENVNKLKKDINFWMAIPHISLMVGK